MEFDEDDPLANRNRANDLERIKQAKKKRISQLKTWQQYDKLLEKNKGSIGKFAKSKFNKKNIHFPQSLVLLEAAGRGDIDEVKQILQDGVDPDVCNEDGLTALHQCCIDNNLAICQLLLQYGVNINATDSEMWTPLHAAAACAHIDICTCLIESGAELLALNAEGNMPYDICEEENTLDLIENAMAARGISQEDIDEQRKFPELTMLRDLQRTDEDLTELDEQGASYLHIASSCGYMDVGKFLLDNYVPVDILDKDGWQAIHLAACWGQLEFIELLLVRGADINSTTRLGETIYDICEDPEMNQRLIQIKQEMERQSEVKKTLDVRPSRSQLSRRSTLTKRSASIRRSSMREKSLMSWKEARQEALIREAVQKQISTDVTIDSGQSYIDNDQSNGFTNDEIDISQVMVNVQLVTENELALKEPLIRRGSTRNSFTHSHPYHSPSRDPTLMETSIDEDSSIGDKNETDDDINTFIPVIVSTRNSQRTSKNQSSNISIKTKVSPEVKKMPVNNSSFVRNCDPNVSVKGARPIVNNVSQRQKEKKEIDNRPLVKAQKTQGCCILM